ncbi:MAG: acyl-CoA dehydrogenase C-terminal domain-containing protein [Desulfomonilaceae bacterium]
MELFLADSALYLELFGITAVGWQWLLQGTIAQTKLFESQSESQATFYKGKLWTMKYFFHYEMPKIEGLVKRLLEADGLTAEMNPALFTD